MSYNLVETIIVLKLPTSMLEMFSIMIKLVQQLHRYIKVKHI